MKRKFPRTMEQQKSENERDFWPNLAWDLWCLASIIGIWPRFIEPQLLLTKKISVAIPRMASSLEGLRIAFFSDLHIGPHTSPRFLIRLLSKIDAFKPHLILFGGDALSYSLIYKEALFRSFFSSLKAPWGTFATLGNHDYDTYTTESHTGEPLICRERPTSILWGLKKLFQKKPSEGVVRKEPVGLQEELLSLFKKCNVQPLMNTTEQVGEGSLALNLTGLGDLTAGHFDPQAAFTNWNHALPGIVLGHNPNVLPSLVHYPGDLLLFGHTHGGQVNLPFFWKRLVYVSDVRFKSGLLRLGELKTAYITRGVGSCYPFRWFAPPELVLCTLKRSSHVCIEAKEFMRAKVKESSIQWATSRVNHE